MSVVWVKRAHKALSRMDATQAARIVAAVTQLYEQGQGDVKWLKGDELGRLRLRVGSYRVVFRLESQRLVVLAVSVRGQAYK